MHLVFGMVAAVFDFFANIADRVDFMGLNLWQISFIVFVVSSVFRWLFPVLFSGEGSTPSGGFIRGVADSVKAGSVKFKQVSKKRKKRSG